MNSGKTPRHPAEDCRCVCGSLVARLVTGGVELKCRRCKRTLLVPISAGVPPGPPAFEVIPARGSG
jgi:hypothetical protein